MSLFQMSVMGGVLILAAALLRAVAGRYLPRRTFLWLWTIAVCRLLLPLRVPSPLSVYGLLRSAARISVPASSALQELGTQPFPVSGLHTIAAQPLAHRADIRFVIWVIGAVLLALYFIGAFLYWQHRFAHAKEVSTDAIKGWRQDSPLRRPLSIRELEGLGSPLTYGLLRPIILLPAGFSRCPEPELRCILTHEYVHIRRLDAVRKLALAVTLCLHWFNPAVWLLLRLADRDMELFCDEQVLTILGESRRKLYAATLLQTASLHCDEIPLCNSFGKAMIEERIVMISKKHTITLFSTFLAVLLLVGLTTALATTAPDETPEPSVSVNIPVSGTTAAAPAVTPPAQSLDAAAESEIPTLIWPAKACPTITGIISIGKPDIGETSGSMEISHITISGENAAGSDICAAAAGTVEAAAWNSRVGYYVEIDHGNGLETRYTHCAELLVSQGSTVTQGQVIATVGQSGMATGPCLGFYVAQNGKTIDPTAFFPEN